MQMLTTLSPLELVLIPSWPRACIYRKTPYHLCMICRSESSIESYWVTLGDDVLDNYTSSTGPYQSHSHSLWHEKLAMVTGPCMWWFSPKLRILLSV